MRGVAQVSLDNIRHGDPAQSDSVHSSVNPLTLFRNTEELLRQVLDTIPQRVFWKDTRLKYLGCNRNFARDAGFEHPHELIGLDDFQLPAMRDNAEFRQECDQRILNSGVAESGIIEPLINKDGQTIWLEMNKVPLRDTRGNVIGILGAYHDITRQRKAEQDLKQLNEQLEQRVHQRTAELHHLAHHDGLTGLANRNYFTRHLSERIARKDDRKYALLFIDLNHFKEVNDTEGHEAGDHLLVSVAGILKKVISPNDMVSRFGGDEFLVLLDDVEDRAQVEEICQSIHSLMETNVNVGGMLLPMSASIGIAYSDNHQYDDASEIIHDADTAMYVAKASRRRACRTHRFFREEMLHQVGARRTLEKELLDAIEHREFFLLYQPIFDIEKNRIESFEALVRWQHPGRGLLEPHEFVPFAEECGLIVELGEYIFQSVCDQIRIWWTELPEDQHRMKVNVNLSARQIKEDSFLEMMLKSVNAAGVPASAIQLEITESLLLQDGDDAVETLNRVQKCGFGVVLDDFGTGYSSLSYLDQLPVDILKIDRAFVQKLDSSDGSDSIIRMILALARSLNMKVIAEGVETSAQADRLRDIQCDLVQGYFYAKPMDANKATFFMQRRLCDPSLTNVENDPQAPLLPPHQDSP